jgi:hypothetical protein
MFYATKNENGDFNEILAQETLEGPNTVSDATVDGNFSTSSRSLCFGLLVSRRFNFFRDNGALSPLDCTKGQVESTALGQRQSTTE